MRCAAISLFSLSASYFASPMFVAPICIVTPKVLMVLERS